MGASDISTFSYRLRMFRLRRFIFGRFHRNPLVRWIALECWKNYSAWMNHDFNLIRNGEGWLAARLAQEPSFGSVPVLFDVGANKGDWSILAAKANPQAEIHAFEIAEGTFEALAGRCSGYRNLTTRKMGLFSRDGEIEIYRNRGSDTTGAFLHPDEEQSMTLTAPVMRGDAYMTANGVERVNLLKIDVEGAESEVLAGFREAINQDRIDVIQFEYAIFNIAARKFLKDYYGLLQGRFRIGRLFPSFVDFSDYSTDMEDFAPSNYVAVRRDLTGLIGSLSAGR